MKQFIIMIILAVTLLSACSKEESVGSKKDRIFELKEELARLEKEMKNTDTLSHGKQIKVQFLKAKKEHVVHQFRATGTVKAVNFAYISPEMNGQIQKIYVKEGQYVKKGQLLASLNAKVMLNTKKELELALELATTLYEKQKKLWAQKVGKEIDYLTAKNKKESLEAKISTLNSQISMSRITAPFSGIVDEIHRKVGELAAPGMQFIDLVNLSDIEIEADVSEKYLPYLKKGDAVELHFPAFPDMQTVSKISRIGNIINPANRTFKVVLNLKNPNKMLKPNMIVDLMLSDYAGNDILLPSDAVKSDQKGDFVFVISQNGGKNIAQKRYVKTGRNIKTNTIITEGLTEGDKVVIQGHNLLSNGSEVYW